MAYPVPFLRLVVAGTLFSTEQFAFSLSLMRNFSNAPAPSTVPQGVIDAVATYFQDPATQTGANAVLTSIKLNEIGPNGRYLDPSATVLHEFDPGLPGVGTANLPPQCAVAVTLRTAARRGLANTGRFYLPHVTNGPSNDGRLLAGAAQGIATSTTTFLNSLRTALGDDFIPAVASDTREGQVRAVTHVEVGRVVDTIRSRRSSLDEDRQVGEPLAP